MKSLEHIERLADYRRTLDFDHLISKPAFWDLKNGGVDIANKFQDRPGCQFSQFVGMWDHRDNPYGLVRSLDCRGALYEGQMTSDGKYNGFGILYQASYADEDKDMIYIGFWKNGQRHGNSYHIEANSWKVKMKGWYNNGALSSRVSSDPTLCPKFDYVDVLFHKPKNLVQDDPSGSVNIKIGAYDDKQNMENQDEEQ